MKKFNTKEELYEKIWIALKIKKKELSYFNISITEYELWQFLIENFFKNAYKLTLSDIVNKILNVNYKLLEDYIKNY